jgi:ATP-dependent DNA helicase DinG
MQSVEKVFRDTIANLWQDYEPRESQIKMSKAVQDTISNGGILIAEAGTGVGKSLAYLLPAAIWALENNGLVVISTETKALQDQLLKKDIPLVRSILKKEIRAEIAMGASNYLCKRKFSHVDDSGNLDIDMIHQYDRFLDWVKSTTTGMRTEYQGNIPLEYWMKISRESDNCLGKSCKNYSHSYYFLEKEKWKNSHLLIVNHSLLSSHMAGNFRLLPEFKKLIIDEAHNFSEIVGKSFQSDISFEAVNKLLGFIHSKDSRTSLLSKMSHPSDLIQLVEDSKNASLHLFGRLPEQIKMNMYGAERITQKLKLDDGNFENTINKLIESLAKRAEKYSKESEHQEEKEVAQGIEMSVGRLSGISEFFYELRNRENPNLVFWNEPPNLKKNEKFIRLLSEPINVDEIIGEGLVPRMDSLVFASATLTTGKKNFTFFKDQTGIHTDQTICLESPFDYTKQAILFLPQGIRDPKDDDFGYHEDITKKIRFLIELTQGDCFVLFTSNKSLNQVRSVLESRIPFPIYSQTVLGAVGAKKMFMENKNSVLFGVASFWQGVDIKGDKLKNVIITKLPFQVPTEPVLQTKMELLKEKNQDPFRNFQLPRAGIVLKQGFGRLIRSRQDYGIVSILDPRISTKSYGKEFLAVFPTGIKTIQKDEELVQSFQNLPKLIV